MNWFKRYGIVGLYFLLISSLWLYACFDLNITNLEDLEVKSIMSIMLMLFLPVGYIITVISQWFYYIGFFGKGVNLRVYNELKEDKFKNDELKDLFEKSEKIKTDSKLSESDIEVLITFYRRYVNCKIKDETERTKHLGVFMTRRFDVVSINKALILSTWLPFILLLIFRFFYRPYLFHFNIEFITILLFISIVITVFLILSYIKLEDQIELLLINALSFPTENQTHAGKRPYRRTNYYYYKRHL